MIDLSYDNGFQAYAQGRPSLRNPWIDALAMLDNDENTIESRYIRREYDNWCRGWSAAAAGRFSDTTGESEANDG